MPTENRRASNTGIIIGVALLLLMGIGFYGWQTFMKEEPVPVPVTEVPVVDPLSTYASSTMGITLKYPKRYVLDDSYRNGTVNPAKPINGVKLTLPIEMATGTNLSLDSGISIEQLPRANSCTGDIYLALNVQPTKVMEGNVAYSLATSSDAGAGNLYEEWVYAIASSSPCTAVRYFIHSTQLANYPAGAVRQFDKAALLLEFDTIRRSLVLE